MPHTPGPCIGAVNSEDDAGLTAAVPALLAACEKLVAGIDGIVWRDAIDSLDVCGAAEETRALLASLKPPKEAP